MVLGSVLELITIIGAWIFAKNSVKTALGTSGINVLKKAKFNAENTLLLTEKSTSWYKKSVDPANISYKDWDKNHDRLEEVFPFQKIHITSFLAAFFVAIFSAFLAANLLLGIVFFSIVFIPVFLV